MGRYSRKFTITGRHVHKNLPGTALPLGRDEIKRRGLPRNAVPDVEIQSSSHGVVRGNRTTDGYVAGYPFFKGNPLIDFPDAVGLDLVIIPIGNRQLLSLTA